MKHVKGGVSVPAFSSLPASSVYWNRIDSKLMRPRLLVIPLLLGLGVFALLKAQASAPFAVTAMDLEEAGYTSVVPLGQEGSRFSPPVTYFRVAERLSEEQARRDCEDCADLVAVHLAESTAPAWASSQEPLRIVGGRTQARRYHAPTRTIIIVTGPDTERVAALSDLLLIRAAGN